MAEMFSRFEQAHIDFIGRQHIFFTATAAAGSRINISPRSTEAFRVIAPDRVGYLDMTGSGSETAAHLRADGRMTMMFCAVTGPPPDPADLRHGREPFHRHRRIRATSPGQFRRAVVARAAADRAARR